MPSKDDFTISYRKKSKMFLIIDISELSDKNTVNNVVKKCIYDAKFRSIACDISLSIDILVFNTTAKWICKDEDINTYNWIDLECIGDSEPSIAFNELNERIKLYHKTLKFDPVCILSTIILISDYDKSESSFDNINELFSNGWFRKAIRIGIAMKKRNNTLLTSFATSEEAVIFVDNIRVLKKLIRFPEIFIEWLPDEEAPIDLLTTTSTTKNIDETISNQSSVSQDKLFIPIDTKDLNNSDEATLRKMKSYSEVWAIINAMDPTYYNMIPSSLKLLIDKERLFEYQPKVDTKRSLNKQGFLRETMALLAVLDLNYWCDSEQKRIEILKQMAANGNESFDLADDSWNLASVFGSVKQEERSENDNNVYIHMPNGVKQLFLNDCFFANMDYLSLSKKENLNECGIEIRLDNVDGPHITVKNKGVENLYISHIIHYEEIIDFDNKLSIRNIETDYTKNIIISLTKEKNNSSKMDSINRGIIVLKPLYTGDSSHININDILVNELNECIMRFSIYDNWIIDDWEKDWDSDFDEWISDDFESDSDWN